MNKILNVVLVLSLVQRFTAAQNFQSIQNAGPLNIDLSSPSATGIQSSADSSIEEHKLGGYRPLYPPYFVRDPVAPQSGSNYFDRDYYTRGQQQQQQHQQRQLINDGFNRIEFARGIPSGPIFVPPPNTKQSVHVYTFSSASSRSIRFPAT